MGWKRPDRYAASYQTQGKCTTDHIFYGGSSAEVPWTFAEHLRQPFNGAVNAFNGESNKVKNQLDALCRGFYHRRFTRQKASAASWWQRITMVKVLPVSTQYGVSFPQREGDSRQSFARIHETNLKKQGMLALTFCNKDDYNKVQEDDRILRNI